MCNQEFVCVRDRGLVVCVCDQEFVCVPDRVDVFTHTEFVCVCVCLKKHPTPSKRNRAMAVVQ